VTYEDLRAANARAYRRQNASLFGLVPTWGPLWPCSGQIGTNPQSLFNQIHDASIAAIAAQQKQVDWTETYAAVKPLLESPQLVRALAVWRESVGRHWPKLQEHDFVRDVLAQHIRREFTRGGHGHLLRVQRIGTGIQAKSIDPSALIATIITAVLAVVCPPTAAFSAILEPIVAVIIKVLFSSLTTSFASGTYGGSQDAFRAQVQAWAQEATAAP
jgi:hypothetical protein